MNPLDSTLPDLVLTTEASERCRWAMRSIEAPDPPGVDDLLGLSGGTEEGRPIDIAFVRWVWWTGLGEAEPVRSSSRRESVDLSLKDMVMVRLQSGEWDQTRRIHAGTQRGL